MQSFNTLILTTFFFITSVLSFDVESQNNIAVYWGQNSQGGQQRLSEYCQSSNADIFILSFLNIFPNNMGLNFANACSETFGDNAGLLHCSDIASDIQTCQSLGKKVLLSLGGASGAYGFASNDEADAFAETLWNTFGEGSTTDRPFDSAVVDGFDFDIENNINIGYAALVNKLRDLFKKGTKQYYISAAPQCPYPDASVGDLLSNAQVDFAFIQFYNNYCNVDRQFNWNDWENYASTVSPNSNIKLFLGLPGSPTAAGSGFISDLNLLQNTVNTIKTTKNFGGIAIWDASQGFSYQVEGKNYIENVENVLNNAQTTVVSTSSVKTTSILTPATTTSITSSSNTILSERITSTLSPVVSSTPVFNSLLTSTPDPVLIAVTQTEQAAADFATTTAHHTDAKVTTVLTPAIIVDKDIIVSTSTTISPVDPTITVVALPTTPATTTAATTTTLSPATSTTQIYPGTSTTQVSSDAPVHEQAQQLNQLYAAGKFNGQETCTEAEMSCSDDGKFAICNFGVWVTMECASGTTCYSYDQDGQLFTQCGYIDIKNNFI
ncbi:Chitinase 1 [Monosporozyma unispora]|nr:Chitinase 1 [Kazachstania unispora]